MRDEARYDRDHRRIGLDGKVEHLLKLFLAFLFRLDILCAVIRKDRLIRFAVVGIDVDAVQNADKFEFVPADDRVELVRIERVFDLLRIARADRRKLFAALDRRFHQVDAFVVFEKIPPRIRDAEQVFEDIQRILPLVLDIVDREERSDELIFGAETIDRL